MKRILLTALTILASLPMLAQLNVQMHYDFADALYGNELSNRAHWTATIENFKADKWGSTYFSWTVTLPITPWKAPMPNCPANSVFGKFP